MFYYHYYMFDSNENYPESSQEFVPEFAPIVPNQNTSELRQRIHVPEGVIVSSEIELIQDYSYKKQKTFNVKLTSFKFANDFMAYIAERNGLPFLKCDEEIKADVLLTSSHLMYVDKWIINHAGELYSKLELNPMHHPFVSESTFHLGSVSFRKEFSEKSHQKNNFIDLCIHIALFGVYAFRKGFKKALNHAMCHIMQATFCMRNHRNFENLSLKIEYL